MFVIVFVVMLISRRISKLFVKFLNIVVFDRKIVKVKSPKQCRTPWFYFPLEANDASLQLEDVFPVRFVA